MESSSNKATVIRARSIDKRSLIKDKQTLGRTNGSERHLVQGADTKIMYDKYSRETRGKGVVDKAEGELSASSNIVLGTKQNIDQLMGLVQQTTVSQQVTKDAFAILEACFFIIYDKLIPTWQKLEFELKLRGKYFLEELDTFDKISLVAKRIDDREFRRIKAAIETVRLEDEKKNPYSGLLQALKAWVMRVIKFHDEWQASFESSILNAK